MMCSPRRGRLGGEPKCSLDSDVSNLPRSVVGLPQADSPAAQTGVDPSQTYHVACMRAGVHF